jgi:hypothetical protein
MSSTASTSSTSVRSRLNFLQSALERPRAAAVIIGTSLLLMTTSLDSGLFGDDYLHQLILEGSREIPGFERNPLDIFRFTFGDSLRRMQRAGVVSWWDDPDAKLSFFRPLSALTHYLDHLYWPHGAWLMHLHSLFWAWLVFLGVWSLYRAVIKPMWVARLALFFYVLDDARAWFVSWVAARNAVVATAVSIWALVFYHRYRSERWRPGVWLTPLFFLLSLLAGEGSIAICGYLFAYALFLDRGALRIRLRALLPYAALAVVWRLVYTGLGYGVAGSGLYADPARNPWGFALAVAERAPMLILAQFAGVWSDTWNFAFLFPKISQAAWLAAIAFGALLTVVLWPLLKRDSLAQFGAMGVILSAVTASTTFPADRLLSWIAIGASILLARFITLYSVDFSYSGYTPGLSKLAAITAPVLLLINGAMAPLLLPMRARGGLTLSEALDRANASLPSDPAITGKVVVLVNPPGVPMAAYLPIIRAATGVPRPKAQYWLATSTSALSLERVDATSLKVRPAAGFLANPADLLFRDLRRPFKVGEQVDLGPLTIQVTDVTADGRPSEILAHFSLPLEDPSFVWFQWGERNYVPLSPPGPGTRIVLPATNYCTILIGEPIEGCSLTAK